jgi:hypothetical protein
MHSVSKAKFAAADIYSGGAGYHPFSRVQQHENGGGPVIDSAILSSYITAPSGGKSPVQFFECIRNNLLVLRMEVEFILTLHFLRNMFR